MKNEARIQRLGIAIIMAHRESSSEQLFILNHLFAADPFVCKEFFYFGPVLRRIAVKPFCRMAPAPGSFVFAILKISCHTESYLSANYKRNGKVDFKNRFRYRKKKRLDDIITGLRLRKNKKGETLMNSQNNMNGMNNSNSSSSSRNRQNKSRLSQFKNEVASSMNVDLKQGYNGDLTSREAGSIGGEMVKRMIAYAEQNMSDNN